MGHPRLHDRNWGGFRDTLATNGVNLEFFYIGSNPRNLSGGLKTGSVYQGALFMTLDLKSEPLLGYAGGTFHVSGEWLNGDKPFSDKYIGDYNHVNLIDFPNSSRVLELYYQQKLLDDKLSIKVGELCIDSDFISPVYYSTFGDFTLINQTFFFPSLPYGLYNLPYLPKNNNGLSTSPYSTPGAVIKVNLRDDLYAQVGTYSGAPDQGNGVQFDFNKSAGVLTFAEIGYQLNAGTNNPGLGGSYKVGGYYDTSDYPDSSGSIYYASGLSPTLENHHGNYGGYLLAEQELFLEHGKTDPARQGLLGFFRVLAAPPERNLTQLELDGGLVYRGIIPTRRWDSLAVAYSYLEFSKDIRSAQQQINQMAPGTFVPVDAEQLVEVSYKVQATAWWTIQPSFQWVIHPGGSSAIPNSCAFILQTTLRF
jgi:porin